MTWDVRETVTDVNNLTLAVEWYAAWEIAGFTRASCWIAHYSGGVWDAVAPGNAGAGPLFTITRAGITSLSPFSVFGPAPLFAVIIGGGNVPTMGEWALIIMTLVFLSLGTIALRKHLPSAKPI